MKETTKRAVAATLAFNVGGLLCVSLGQLLQVPATLMQISIVLGVPISWVVFLFELPRVVWTEGLIVRTWKRLSFIGFGISIAILIYAIFQSFQNQDSVNFYSFVVIEFWFSFAFLLLLFQSADERGFCEKLKFDVFVFRGFPAISLLGIAGVLSFSSMSLVYRNQRGLGSAMLFVVVFSAVAGVKHLRSINCDSKGD